MSARSSWDHRTFPRREQALLISRSISKRDSTCLVIILPEEITTVENKTGEKKDRQIRDFFFRDKIPVFLTTSAFTPVASRRFREAASLSSLLEGPGPRNPFKGKPYYRG
jgi:hypothetical protein